MREWRSLRTIIVRGKEKRVFVRENYGKQAIIQRGEPMCYLRVLYWRGEGQPGGRECVVECETRSGKDERSVCLFVCLFLCVCAPVCSCFFQSVYQFVCLCLSVCCVCLCSYMLLCACLSVRLSVCLYVCLPICLSISLSLFLSLALKAFIAY